MPRITSDSVPAYDELPRLQPMDLPHAWDFFGPGDELGTLNYLGPETVLATTAACSSGVVVTLNLPLTQPDPPLFGREPTRHSYFTHDRNTWDERLDAYFPQGSSQWDGFRHVRAREHGFFGGVQGEPADASMPLGIDVWARRGIVGRGVLVDVAAHLEARGHDLPCDVEDSIPASLLAEVLEAQGVVLQHGDILLVRTGWPARYAALSEDRRRALSASPTLPGLDAGEDTARALWEWHVAALVTDVPAVEPSPGDPAVGSLHRRLLPLLGIPLGELFDLEALGAECRRAGRFTFLFSATPINLPGGCGSPANALAIF